MALIGEALRQAFMPKHEYENLREEEKAWGRIQRPLVISVAAILWLAVILSASVSLKVVFPSDISNRPLCHDHRLQPLLIVPENRTQGVELLPHAYYLTDEEAAQYYWLVVFIPSALIFFCSLFYLLAGGVRCLSVINFIFAAIFALFAVLLGSSILTLGSNCSVSLFWCYEVLSWSLVVLYGGTGLILVRKAAMVLDEGQTAGNRTIGIEMLESPPLVVTPEMVRRINGGFNSWMDSTLSSDEDDPDEN